MIDDDFEMAANMELSRRDTQAVMDAMKDGSGLTGQGIAELIRLGKAQEAFPGMTLQEMWRTDRRLEGIENGRPKVSDIQKVMKDPSWVAVADLEHLKGFWKEMRPGQQVPLEFLTDIVARYRDIDRATLVARRSRPKSRRVEDN